VASSYPLLANLRIAAAQALNTYQGNKQRFGVGLIDRALSGANLWFAQRILRRPLILSVRNTFRNKGRLVLALITLTLAGAIFISVFSVRASLLGTIDELLSWWGFDTYLTLSRPYRAQRIIETAQAVSGVERTDIWLQLPASRVRDDGTESGAIYLFAVRPDSELVLSPTIIEGRWLLPQDDNALVISAIMLTQEPDIQVGDEIVLKVAGRERPYRVVGVSMGIMVPMAYARYSGIAEATGNTGRAGTALVRTESHDEGAISETTAALEAHFDQTGLQVSDVQTMVQERTEAAATFDIIIGLLMIMAVLLAIVGGLGLAGMVSINVLERTREIGVLRAIGASNRDVARVFVFESIAVGLLSWTCAVICSIPLGRELGNAICIPLLGTPMTFIFAPTGMWLWLLAVVALSGLASALPARKATRLTVREVLAYE
jgi:putative ABC transport system permease protein